MCSLIPSRRHVLAATTLMLVLLALCAPQASAQPGVSVTFGRAFGSIAETGVLADTRQTTAAAIEAEQALAGERLRLFYDLDAGTYATPGDWHYYLHTAGGTWRVKFGQKKENTLYLGASGSWRANGASWSAADYRALGFIANTELHPRGQTTVRLGYRLDAREFPDLAELNQVQHDGFASVLVTLPTRTTLIGEAHLGTKSYADTTLVPAPTESLDVPSSASAGGRMGRGMGPSLRAAGAFSLPAVEQNRAGMVTWMARVAQALTDRTGASVQYYQRATFGRVAPLVVTTPALYFDDGVYDDPFASDARVVAATLKHVFAGGMVLEGFGSRMLKDYNGLLALGPDGAASPDLVLRADQIWRASAGWTIPVLPSRTGPIGVDLNIAYFYTRHRSNDAFYNYTSHTVGLGVTLSY